MTKWTLRCVVLCGWLLASASLHAHHSLAGMYALGKEAKVTGAFKAFRLVNPHSSMKLDVKNPDGTINRVGVPRRQRHRPCEARDRQNRTERPQTRG